MKKNEKKETTAQHRNNPNVLGLRADVVEQRITDTLETNYMPYAMSVIVSRAIPEIDGFKPSHRKLLYTMYKMGLLNGARTKSANIVGQTMRLNPHGDAAIYDTMVRLSKGYGALLHPFVDSKGNFGKVYSRDMAWAASRYTEAKLSAICAELFRDIDSDTVDFIDNYDNTMKEPALLPTTFPNILVSANQGIAVGMASQLCGFNLGEVCDTTIAYLKNPDCDLTETLLAPDFPTGGEVICDVDALREIYSTGRGGVKVRARWRYDKKENLIEVYEIPYTTTTEAIMDKVAELIKAGKVKEITDMRDETDLNGLKLTIDLKRGTDPDKLMQKLMKSTTLQDTMSCNFNVLIAGMPRVMGVRELLDEWCAWRTECVRRRVYFVMSKKKDKLHLLKGLKQHPARHRQGDQDHPRDGGRGRRGAEPDDRLRHRPSAGGVCRGDQAAQHQQGIYPQARGGDERPAGRDRGSGGYSRPSCAREEDHRHRAGGRAQKVRRAAPHRHRLRPRGRGIHRGDHGGRLRRVPYSSPARATSRRSRPPRCA